MNFLLPLKYTYKKWVPERRRIDARFFLFRLRGLFYRGARVSCNLCGGRFRKFLPYRPANRPDAACPACNTWERHRLLWFYLERETDFFSRPRRVLHFAPERILEQKLRRMKNIEYLTADLNPAAAEQVVDISRMDFPENRFDWIFCLHVLAHVKDEPRALRELFRILRPSGTAVVMSRVDPALEKTVEVGRPGLFRLHGADFPALLEGAGFTVSAVDYARTLGPELTRKHGLGRNEWIYVCRK